MYDGRCVLFFLTLCTELRSCLDLRSQSVIMYAKGVHTAYSVHSWYLYASLPFCNRCAFYTYINRHGLSK